MIQSPSCVSSTPRWAPPQARWRAAIKGVETRIAAGVALGLESILGPRQRGSFGILMYHRVADNPPHVGHPSINVTPGRFRMQLRGLLARGFEFWPLRRALDAARNGDPIPAHVVVVTFDDGFECVHTKAVPILRELGIPATVFLATAFLDSGEPFPFDHWGLAHRGRVAAEAYRPMRWRQCLELRDDPLIELAAHTHTHQDFRGRADLFENDLRKCLTCLQSELGIERPTFAFPYGTPHLGFVDDSLVTAAKRTGVSCGLTTESALVEPQSDPFDWGRIYAFPWDSGATLSAKLHGWYTWAPQQQHRVLSFLRNTVARSVNGGPARRLELANAGNASRDFGDCAVAGPASGEGPSERPLISVVVPSFNRAHWLGDAIQSLVDQEPDSRFGFEVLVVDNGSTDNTRGVVERCAAQSPVPVRYLFQSRPGDAPTRNAGVRAARGDYIAFFDDDQFADRRWLSELYSAAKSTGASVVGGPVLLDIPDDASRRLDRICRRALREVSFYPRLRPYAVRDLPGTGNALVDRNLFARIGGFDESLVSGGSDSDFFLRARNAGYRLWYTPTAAIRHRIPPERLSVDFFRWDALSGGAGHAAHFDYKARGLVGMVAICWLRLTHMIIVNGPLYLWARAKGDEAAALGRMLVYWRTEGYLRGTLSILAPGRFAQKAFFDSIEFWRGRTIGKQEVKSKSPSDIPEPESTLHTMALK